jgi:hypothetical protein
MSTQSLDAMGLALQRLGLKEDQFEPFEWPCELMSFVRKQCREMLGTVFAKRASTKSFALWLVEHGEDQDIPRRLLHTLYEEYCCLEKVRPMRMKALERDIRKNGFDTVRPLTKDGPQRRPTIYSVNRSAVFPPLRKVA